MARHVTFDYERVLTPIGFVWVPVARVKLSRRGNALELDMTVDSGADLTMLPIRWGSAWDSERGHRTSRR